MGQTASIDRTYWFIAGYHYKLKKRKTSAVSWKIDRLIPSNSVNMSSVNLGGDKPFVEEELNVKFNNWIQTCQLDIQLNTFLCHKCRVKP